MTPTLRDGTGTAVSTISSSPTCALMGSPPNHLPGTSVTGTVPNVARLAAGRIGTLGPARRDARPGSGPERRPEQPSASGRSSLAIGAQRPCPAPYGSAACWDGPGPERDAGRATGGVGRVPA